MRYPGELNRPSDRAYHGLDPLEYPFHDRTVAVPMCGRVCSVTHVNGRDTGK
jgi:putative transposase